MTMTDKPDGNDIIWSRFRQGTDGGVPTKEAVTAAARIAEAVAGLNRSNAEIGVSPDGWLYFDVRNHSGHLILGELRPDGRRGATLYDDHGHPVRQLPPTPCREDEVNGALDRILQWLQS